METQKISTPEAQGIPSEALIALAENLEAAGLPMHSLLIARHGYLTAQLYWKPYGKDTLHRMFSQTKSFTSLAVGLLEAEKKISLQDRICTYFPEYLPGNTDPWLAEMTIEHMLKMETCYDRTTYNKTSTTENWVRSFFQAMPTHRPGTIFQYDTSASHTLCALVEKLTGQKLLDFLKDRVLRQIGFSEESYVLPDPFGVSLGGTGLMAKPMDILRTGLMLLNHGIHPDDYGNPLGRQVYPRSYLDRALSFQTPTVMKSDVYTGYGYQFWMLPEGGFSMFGMGGQNLYCLPRQDLVIVTTADTQGIPNGSEEIFSQIRGTLLPALSDHPLEEGAEASARYQAMAERLTLPVPKGENWPLENTVKNEINGTYFSLRRNPGGFKRIKVEFYGEDRGALEYENQSGRHRLPFGIGKLEESLFPEYGQRCVSAAAWYSRNVFYIRSWLIDETVASVHWKLSFGEDGSLTVLMHKTEENKYKEFQGILNS